MRNLGSHFKAAALLTALAIVGSGAAVTAQDEESKTIGFVPPALTSPFHVAMADGATKRWRGAGLDRRRPGPHERR